MTLEYAIKARLPLVTVRTTDPVNILAVIDYYAKGSARDVDDKGWPGVSTSAAAAGSVLVAHWHNDTPKGSRLWKWAIDGGYTIVVVNPPDAIPEAFDAGTAVAPYDLVHDLVVESGAEDPPGVLAVMGGLSLKEVSEVLRIAGALYKSLTPDSVLRARRECIVPGAGLDMVDPTIETTYRPSADLKSIADQEGHFLKHEDDWTLRPRGILLDGDPGTGKTSAARYLATQWSVPLYRLDVGSVKQKYMGESEANLRAALTWVEAEAPCVLLIDEVEKALRSSGDGDSVTPSLIAHLLWWLAEHRERIFTVMTTNDRRLVPDELYRPGRIDRVLKTRLLDRPRANELAWSVVGSYVDRIGEENLPSACAKIKNRLQQTHSVDGPVSHAEVVAIARDAIKSLINDP